MKWCNVGFGKRVAIWVVLSWVTMMAQAIAQQYQFTTLDDPAGTGTQLIGISGSEILGSYVDGSDNTQTFLYSGTFNTLNLNAPGAVGATIPTAISGGNIVGYFDTNDPSGSRLRGFLLSGTTYTVLGQGEGFYDVQPFGVSGSNVVGTYTDTSGNDHGFLYNGFMDPHIDYSTQYGANVTYPVAISGSEIAGYYVDSLGYSQGFVYDAGNYTLLNDPLAVSGIYHTDTEATGISGSNVVGFYIGSDGNKNGFLYNGGNYITLDDPLGVRGTIITGIDGDDLVGYYIDGSGEDHGFMASPVPESATWVSLIVGGGIMLLVIRRRVAILLP